MNPIAVRLARVPLTIGLAWMVLALSVPALMSQYAPYVMRPGFSCAKSLFVTPSGDRDAGGCSSLADLYGVSFVSLFVDSMFRSLALLVGAALLALVIGTLLGVAAALLRRRVWASGGIVGVTTLLTAVPAFFVAYFLQIAVIVIGASATSRDRLLPVFGFGYDEHLILPLLSISLPAIAFTAQLTATRMIEVLNADFIIAAEAKGLPTRTILGVHVLPHVRPVLIEALGSGLRVSVASLPIVEYLFLWRGIGQLVLEAVGVHDAAGFIFCGVALAALFITLSALADLSRPKALYRATSG
jgi:peptide/nickel transport system permease protein